MALRLMDPEAAHDWLVLVPQGHSYHRFLSDLAAYDPMTHDQSVTGVVFAVMSWLATRPDALQLADPKQVLEVLPGFQAARRELDIRWGGYPPWADVIMAAIEAARTLP